MMLPEHRGAGQRRDLFAIRGFSLPYRAAGGRRFVVDGADVEDTNFVVG